MKISLPQSPNGYVLYDGKSQLNGEEILAIAVGFNSKSENEKTGAMVQIHIIPKEHPSEAYKAGKDDSVCGDCKHRSKYAGGMGTCYVNVATGTSAVWRTYLRGRYSVLSQKDVAHVFKDRIVRFGAYGDPASVPMAVWNPILSVVKGYTSYTHQWNKPFAQSYRSFSMASVDTQEEYELARNMGWRTFRVRTEHDSLNKREFICPASKEGGMRLNCIDCLACNGNGANPMRGNVSIIVHGIKGKIYKFNREMQ